MVSPRSDIADGPNRGQGFKDRQSERTAISTNARLTQQNWYTVEVKICDVSSTGFMAECYDNVSIGSYVTLEVPGIGHVRAQVRWQVGRRMGGMFLDPIHLNSCEWVAEMAGAPHPAG